MTFKCECKNWTRVEGVDLFMDAHHSRCPKYATEKRPRLFYWEDAFDKWAAAPDRIDGIVDIETMMAGAVGVVEIRFKRIDMTDKELAELPEV